MTMSGNAAESKKNMIIELHRFQLRNTLDSMPQRTTDFFGKSLAPALQRAGINPIGAFGSVIAEDGPFILLVTQHPSLNAWGETSQKLAADKEWASAREKFTSGPLPFVRSELSLLRGFDTVPGIEVLPALPDKKTRIFELRTYESNTPVSLARKIRMFDEGEVALFRKLGITPVFFGATITGRNMPNLTYLVAYEDLAARDKAWTTFVSHPEWIKMRSQPGVSDGEIVSNISNSILRPLPFSALK